MSTSLHIPEGLHSFHVTSKQSLKSNPLTILLKKVVADLQKWLNCSWAAGMIPEGSDLVPELSVVCVSGDSRRQEVPDLICPIRGNSTTGLAAIVAVGPRNDGVPYTDEDHQFADALCGHLGGLLGNERLARNISRDLAAIEQRDEESEIARGIYNRLDNYQVQSIRGIEYGGQCRRAGQSCGDFFDLLPSRVGGLTVAIGNVAARGLPGGIMLGGALASVRALVSRGEALVRISAELNRTLWELSPDDSFTSLFCAHVDPVNKCLHYVNAGHEPALVLRSGSDRVERLEPTGAVLGLSRRSVYRELIVPFEPGDLLAAFTDGVAESAGPTGVVQVLREGTECAVQDLAAQVLDAVGTSTDRTIVLVRSNAAAARPATMEEYALAAA
jgi:hypothetical protein